MRALSLLSLIALACAGCLRTTAFHCESNGQCGAGGTCEPVGFCSFVDPECGRRFADSAGPYANQCVGMQGGDAGVDGPTSPDAPITGCPAGYNPLPGMPTGHRYRKVGTPQTWVAQSAACTLTAASAYLAIPDDAAELAALEALAGDTPFWVGIHDMTTNGTFVTVRGTPATFLPWAGGEPDNNASPAEDCVAAVSATQIADDRCDTGSTRYIGICECEP
jgi:hypothetical protein